jgi:hypothetical protein
MKLRTEGSSAYKRLVKSDWSADFGEPLFELDQLGEPIGPRDPMNESWLIRGWLRWNCTPFPGSACLWTGLVIGAAISAFGFLVSG